MGNRRVVEAFKEVSEAISGQLRHKTLCKLICTGHVGDGKLPVFDFWPKCSERVSRAAKPQTSFNLLMAGNCIEQWSSELKVLVRESKVSMGHRMEWKFSVCLLFQPPGEVFVGNVAYCDEEALVSVHFPGKKEDDSFAVYMESYLQTFKLADLQSRFPCMSKESAKKGLREGLVYIAEFADDESLYRARILEVGRDGVSFSP